MAVTTVIKTIGTSRHFSTIAAWQNAAPTDLTTSRSNTTIAGSTSSTLVLDAGASGTNDFYVGHACYATARPTDAHLITAYNGTTKIATIGALNGGSATWGTTPTVETFAIDQTIWQGQCYNDFEFAEIVILKGSASSATCYKDLTVAAGQSFQDNAGVRTNKLTYDQSKGVGNFLTGNYKYLYQPGEDYARTSRLQWKTSSDSSQGAWTNGSGGASGGTSPNQVKDSIFQGQNGTNTSFATFRSDTAVTLINCLFICTAASGTGLFLRGTPCTVIACGVLHTSDQSAAGIAFRVDSYAGSSTVSSTWFFGFSTVDTTPHIQSSGSGHNATDLSTAPGSNNQTSVTFNGTTPLTQAAATNNDCRAIAATALAGNGLLDSTNAPNDISATARANPPTIGPWELAGAVATFIAAPFLPLLQAVKRANFF